MTSLLHYYYPWFSVGGGGRVLSVDVVVVDQKCT